MIKKKEEKDKAVQSSSFPAPLSLNPQVVTEKYSYVDKVQNQRSRHRMKGWGVGVGGRGGRGLYDSRIKVGYLTINTQVSRP